MKRMNIMRGSLLVALALLLTACGGKESVASKSAAAYREAQAKGIAVGGGHDHGGHEAATATSGTADMDHAAHDRTAGGTAMDHAAHGKGGAADHAAMGHGTPDHTAHRGTSEAHAQHAGMQHTAATGADPHAQHRQPAASTQMDHGQHGATPATGTETTDPHAQHQVGGATAAAPIVVAAPRSNADMRDVQPSATLQPDAFDAPAPISVSEAAKATQGGGHEGHQIQQAPMPAADHNRHGAAAATPRTKPAAATLYTCPMHPEVTSDNPGTCPKCGMALVKRN